MTRHEIAIKKNPLDCFFRKEVKVSRKTIVLKKWWPISLEQSPCSAMCHSCRRNISAKTKRFKIFITINPSKRFYKTLLYHLDCLPNDMLEIIKKKEKAFS
jgi:hypothetical protein